MLLCKARRPRPCGLSSARPSSLGQFTLEAFEDAGMVLPRPQCPEAYRRTVAATPSMQRIEGLGNTVDLQNIFFVYTRAYWTPLNPL